VDEKELLQIIERAAQEGQTVLVLSGNELSTLPPEICQLKSLKTLHLSHNRLSTLPSEISELTNLEVLRLFNNELSALPPEICQLTNLKRLYLSGNQLSTLPSAIGELTNLKALYLRDNVLNTLPSEIGKLTNLEWLALRDNQLSELPTSIGQLKKLEQLDLRGNPLPIPPEILEQFKEPTEIINYYLQHLATADKKPLNEAKMLIVGEAKVGKTSLVKRLVENSFDLHETKTDGIAINRWHVAANEVRLNVWDFGGQEIMHATHQFFLTHRSLYVLVLDSRLDEQGNRLEYWLKLIQSYGGDSPIDEFLTSWFAIKEQLETMDDDYIPYSEYQRMCEAQDIDEQSQETLIGFLHDLGIVLHFPEYPTNVLNPEWVTTGVYKIINSYVLSQEKGVLKIEVLNEILDSHAYPRDKQLFIIHMMRTFELCFDFEGEADKRFLVPDLLPKEEPDTGEWDDSLGFQYHYDVLHGSVISRFIVRMHTYISKRTYWRYGVVLVSEDGENKALVKADIEDRKIFIFVKGRKATRHRFLSIIRADFRKIHATISKLKVDEKVPLPDHPEIVVDYNYLLDLKKLGEETFVPIGLLEKVNVNQLLALIEPEEVRETGETNNDFDVFLCHNSEDKTEVKKIGEQLKERGILPWLDEWELRPGMPWQQLLEQQIAQIKSAAVFVGQSGIGPWQEMELAAFLRKFVNQGCPVIPVLLPDAPKEPELPIFLQGMTWVDFRKEDPNPMEQLIWGITGERPR